MIAPNSSKSFPVLRAYAHNGVRFTGTLHTGGTYNGEFGAEVVWDDAGVIDESVLKVEGSGKNAMVTVKTKDPGTSPNGGNALVKIYKAGDGTQTPVWSYHIWVTDYVPDGTNTFTANSGYVFMNRNLGATAYNLSDAPKTYGLLYQWGRKDPFPGSYEGSAGWPSGGIDDGFNLGSATAMSETTNAAGIIASIKNPQRFYSHINTTHYNWLPSIDHNLWNQATTNQKTIYDPCPSGWRVPRALDNTYDADHSPWKGYASTNTEDKWGSWTSSTLTAGMTFGPDTSSKDPNAQYPAAGYRSSNNGSFSGEGANGNYWSVSPYNDSNNYHQVLNLGFTSDGGVYVYGNSYRAYGFSVRCVQE
jgi:uncharacterized protein (TIGR02145 family)